MKAKFERLLQEVDRLLLHVDHKMPPEVDVIENVKKLIKELRDESTAAETGLAPHGNEGRNQKEKGNPTQK